MANPRYAIEDFQLSNSAYIGEQVTFFIAGPGGIASDDKATLYSDLTGATVLPNPQTLNSQGAFDQPVYVDVDCIGLIGDSEADTTGVISGGGSYRGDYQAFSGTATRYFIRDTIRGPAGLTPDVEGNLYESTTIFDSTTFAADLAAGFMVLTLDYQSAILSVGFATRGQINARTVGKAMDANQFSSSIFDVTGKHLVPFGPGFAIDTSTAGGGPAIVNNVTAANKVPYASIDFDKDIQENVAWTVTGPKSANEAATLTFRFRWTAAAGAGDVVCGVSITGFGDGDVLDTAYSAAVKVTDTLIAAGDFQVSPLSAAVTVKNWAQDDTLSILFSRFGADAGDTLTADAKIVGVDIFLSTTAGNDV